MLSFASSASHFGRPAKHNSQRAERARHSSDGTHSQPAASASRAGEARQEGYQMNLRLETMIGFVISVPLMTIACGSSSGGGNPAGQAPGTGGSSGSQTPSATSG